MGEREIEIARELQKAMDDAKARGDQGPLTIVISAPTFDAKPECCDRECDHHHGPLTHGIGRE